jgi:subtilisin family serine protease
MRFGFLVLVFILVLSGFVVGSEIDKDVAKAFDSGEKTVEVIIKMNEVSSKTPLLQSKVVGHANNVENEKKIIHKFENSIAMKINEDDLDDLSADSNIKSVVKMGKVYALLQDSVDIINATPSWSLKSSNVNLTGVGQSVCVIDTGINYSHPDLVGSYLGGYDFVDSDSDPMDGHGHGTHVSGIIAASGGISGVAPSSGIVAIRILDNSGGGSPADLASAIDWCVNNASQFNISVISMSLGCNATIGGYSSSCDAIDDSCYNPAIASAINSAILNNISVLAASGNFGESDKISSPACIQNTTAISSINKNGVISSFSDRSSLVKLFAPGGLINSTRWDPLGDMASCSEDGNYAICSGTSMATPMVAGAIAIIKQYLNSNGQTKTPGEVEDALYNNGLQFIEGVNNFSRINIYGTILSFDVNAPDVTLVSPVNNYIDLSANQSFVCNATDWQLVNVTFKIWNSSGLYYNKSQNLTGISNETSFNLTNIPRGSYSWNCLTFDYKNNSGYASANFSLTIGNNVSSCVVLNNSGENYALDRDIEANGSCIEIGASDVTLDCNGYVITGNGTGYGVNLSNYNGTSILNCGLFNFSQGISKWGVYDYSENITLMHNRINVSAVANNGYGVHVVVADNVVVFNNTVYTLGANLSSALYFNPGINNSNVSNNFLNTTGIQSYGIFPADSHYNTFADNVIVTGGESSDGFDLPGNSSYNVFHNNTITIYGEAGGIDLVYGAHDNNVTNNSIVGWGNAHALELAEGSYGNTLHGNNIVMYGSDSEGLELDNALFNSVSYNSFSCANLDIVANNSSGVVLYGNIFSSSANINLTDSSLVWSYNGIGNRWTSYDQPVEGCVDSNSNGICDSTYAITSGNIDSYPLALVAGAVTIVTSPGGSSSSRTSSVSGPVEILETYNATADEVSSGYTKSLRKSEKISFGLFDFNGERHLLTVNEIGEDYVNLTIESDPINLMLGVGQSAKLNLSSINYYDLLVRLNSIKDNEAELTIQLISEVIEKVIVEEVVITETVVEEVIGEDYFWVVVVLVVVLGAIVFVVLKKGQSKKLKKKETRKRDGKKEKT